MNTESNPCTKVLIAGVGGQGIVFVTNIMSYAAMSEGLTMAISEIHGLAQRGGSVVAGVSIGPFVSGLIERGGADFLLGLEPLEAQRCLPYLHQRSSVIVDAKRILPQAVNAGARQYPDTAAWIEALEPALKSVQLLPANVEDVAPRQRNIYVLGAASRLSGFPVTGASLENAIIKLVETKHLDASLSAFHTGRRFQLCKP